MEVLRAKPKKHLPHTTKLCTWKLEDQVVINQSKDMLACLLAKDTKSMDTS